VRRFARCYLEAADERPTRQPAGQGNIGDALIAVQRFDGERRISQGAQRLGATVDMTTAFDDVQRIEVAPGIRLTVSTSGTLDKPTIVLSNSLATSYGMWDEVVDLLASHARLVRYDMRGHGRSDAPQNACSIERLGQDVLAILDALEISHTVICGVSLGAVTAMWLVIPAPDRVSGLVLANTAANFPPERCGVTALSPRAYPASVLLCSHRWIAGSRPRYRNTQEARVAELAAMIMATSPEGYAGCCEILANTNLLPDLPQIKCRVRLIAG
jgi:3-oxoadipate enol-lactonase